MQHHPRPGRWINLALIAASGGLLAYAIARAVLIPFTHDEALSYLHLIGQFDVVNKTANFHPLNSLGMEICRQVFGPSEWSLRLPNLAAHVLWLVFGFLLIRRVTPLLARVAGFVLLNFNPFILDFFSLARGYGLEMGFMMASAYFLVRAWELRPAGTAPAVRALWVSFGCATLADYGNLTAINYHLPLFAAAVGLLLWEPEARRLEITRPKVRALLGFAGAHVLALAWVVYRLLALRGSGELYYGTAGFFRGTIDTLFRAFLYDHGADTAGLLVAAGYSLLLLLAVGGFLAWRFLQQRAITPGLLLLAIFVASSALTILQSELFHSPYPIDRYGLFLAPPAMLAIVLGLSEAARSSTRGRLVAALLLGVTLPGVLWNFSRAANLDHCLIWKYDKHTRDVVVKLEREFGNRTVPVAVAADWRFVPALNFYRETRHYRWLAEISRDPLSAAGKVAIYAQQPELAKIGPLDADTIARYPEIDTQLLRVRAAHVTSLTPRPARPRRPRSPS